MKAKLYENTVFWATLKPKREMFAKVYKIYQQYPKIQIISTKTNIQVLTNDRGA